ncbi:MAG TPA: fibrobacter succinogenes major paralogous domain-containing protein [Bacteroides reticulotermitis]|nr:fibrobacter succinogenes major paralogous domain-containing protein [Bacteroides reticulotermitis]
MKSYIITLCLLYVWMGSSCNDDHAELPVIVPNASGTYLDARDGYEYHWVRIDGLDWMTESSHYKLDDPTNCLYYVSYEDKDNYDPLDKWSAKYGFLYTQEGAQIAVPEGWRLPSDDDWKKLEKALGMSPAEADSYEWRGAVTGSLMQETSEGTRLNIQMAGYHTQNTIMMTSGYRFMSAYGFYWTSTKDESKEGDFYFYRKLFYNSAQVYRQSMEPKANMLSVRFVRDAQ